MTMAYIRSKYNVPARKGMRIKFQDKFGMIMGAYGAYLRILLDGHKHSMLYHPMYEIEYLIHN